MFPDTALNNSSSVSYEFMNHFAIRDADCNFPLVKYETSSIRAMSEIGCWYW